MSLATESAISDTAQNTKPPRRKPTPTTASVAREKGNTPLTVVPKNYVTEGEAKWFVLPSGPDAGKKLFFYDEIIGDGQAEATLFFVHGNPESSYTYRQTIESVKANAGKTYRVIAMDHIGFGLSDQASFEMVDMHHANNLKQLIDYLDPVDVTLIIHDWGGAIGVGSFIDSPERVNNLVLMNTTIFPMPLKGSNYKNFPFPGKLSWNSLGYLTPWRWWRLVPPLVMFSGVGRWSFVCRALSVVCRAAVGRLTQNECLYRDMFKTRNNALSSMRNVKQTKVWGHGYCYFDPTLGWQDNREFYKNMQDNISLRWGVDGANIGVRALWGEWDPTAQSSVRQQWIDALPQLQGRVRLYPERGHFLEEHEYHDIAKEIVDVSALA